MNWVDPRTDPSPSAAGRPPRTTDDPDAISELVDLCKKGRLYSVERWIVAGKPLQGADPSGEQWRNRKTPLIVAIESQQHDLALLLLCNGYQLALEPRPVLDLALRNRAWDLVELLIAWGAGPEQADPYTVLDTYQSSMMERFWDSGIDFTWHNYLANYLSTSTRNKPAYGWARRHNDDPRVAYQLALALGDAVFEDAVKAVSLLLWAGADPHRKVPSLRWGSGIEGDPDEEHESAIEVAVQLGHGGLLRHLRPNPELDDFEELFSQVCDPDSLEFLFDLKAPQDWTSAIVRNAARMGWSYRDKWSSRHCLEHVFEHHWGQLSTLDLDGCQGLRRYLLKIESDSDLSWLLQKLAKPHHCDEAIFAELTRTPAIRMRMESLRLDKLLPKKTPKRKSKRKQDKDRSDRPERSQNQAWLDGLDPETKAEILRSLISRKQLYDEVWAEPVTKVAERYGVSDVAVAKWCRKMNVPRPGRGFWARKSAGQKVKRVPLPAAKGDKVYVRRPKPSEERPRVSTRVPGLDLFEKPIPIPKEGAPEHPLVKVTRVALESATPDDFGILRQEAQEALDVFVGRSSVNRALRIMNALILALEGAGFAVEVEPTSDGEGRCTGNETVAVINGERIPFHIFGTMERKERAPTYEERMEMRTSWRVRGPFYTFSPTGVLSLQIEGEWYQERHRRKWTDGKPRPLEDCLYYFVRSLLLSADLRREKRGAEISIQT